MVLRLPDPRVPDWPTPGTTDASSAGSIGARTDRARPVRLAATAARLAGFGERTSPGGLVVGGWPDREALSRKRVGAFLREPAPDGPGFAPPDGICLDRQGGAWVADPNAGRVMPPLPGGS